MRFFVVLIGMLGFACVALVAYGLYSDGGLSRALFDADVSLQSMDEVSRRQMLEVWCAEVKAAAERKHPAASYRSEVPANTARQTGGTPDTIETATPGVQEGAPSTRMKRLLARYDTLYTTYDAAKKVWRTEPKGLADTLSLAEEYLKQLDLTWDALDEAEQITVRAQVTAIHGDILANFASANMAFGRLRATDAKIDALYKACRSRYESLKCVKSDPNSG